MVHHQQHRHSGILFAWKSECNSRSTKQRLLSNPREGNESRNPQSHIQKIGISHHRPLCYCSQCQVSSVLISGWSGAQLLGRCLPSEMRSSSAVCLPSNPTTESCPSQDQARQIQGHSHCTEMGQTNMVSIPETDGSETITSPSTSASSADTGCGTYLSPQHCRTPLQGLVTPWMKGLET